MTDCPYEQREWNGVIDKEEYVAEFEYGADGRYALEVEVTGPCPRCRHRSSDGHPLFRVDGFNGGLRGTSGYRTLLAELDDLLHAGELTEVSETRADLLCRCSKVHDGQPERGSGCGASWSLLVKAPS
jgi:hypothetical protein